jgi:hypothetical protein
MEKHVVAGDVISYLQMYQQVGAAGLQAGMNCRLRGRSVFLMSRRPNAPYDDQVNEEEGTLIYEGHDAKRSASVEDPKCIDQPEFTSTGKPTQNGLFAASVRKFKDSSAPPEIVSVFEKLHDGVWVYNGDFQLIDYWTAPMGGRRVFKFKLHQADLAHASTEQQPEQPADDDRVIPSWVKLEVWKRDKGHCTICGSSENLHFDHIIPYSRGGTSKDPKNIQILCSKHNLAKHDRIE